MFKRFINGWSEASPKTPMPEGDDVKRDEQPGIPAQLHQEYAPSREQRNASREHYHGAAAVEYVQAQTNYAS